MSWSSAVELFDWAVDGADAAVARAYDALGVDPDRVTLEDVRADVDDALRPFVVKLADKLYAEDWDNPHDSKHWERFRQELDRSAVTTWED